jgi:hypothetical protein
MTHFSPEAWADFARRNLPPEEELRMQEHLESGCDSCVQTLQVWLGVLEVATGFNVYNPPERGLRFVKALYRAFPPQRPESGRVDVPRLVAPGLAAAGLRGPEASRRHFVFQRGNVLLEIDIEVDAATGQVSLAGQLMNPVAPSSRFGERRVVLLSEQAELTSTTTNQFGEFHMEFGGTDDLMLVVHLEAEALLVTPLPSFVLTRSMSSSGPEMFSEKMDAPN